MNKNVLKVGLLCIFLSFISFIVIFAFGKTYTTKFIINDNYDYEIRLDNYDGEVEILDEKKIDNNYYVKVKSKKPGKIFIALDYGNMNEMHLLYVHKSMVITENNYFGKSTGSEVVPISLLIVLFYILYLLIKKYRNSIKNNLYQYKNIAYLGIIIFVIFFMMSIFKSIFDYKGPYSTINNIISSGNTVSIFLLPVAFITFILVTISNIKLIIKEGRSLKNLLGVFLGLFLCVTPFLPDLIYIFLLRTQIINIFNLNSPGPYIYTFLETLIYLSISYLECLLIGTIILAIKTIKFKPEHNKDYMIILGCKIRDDGSLTPLLKGRVDRALEFREEQLNENGKDLVFIPSGGKGNDEVITEAEAIKNYLIDKGIKKKNILVEDKSKNTYENINFSNKLINNKKANICFSTTNYHVLRAGLIATDQNIKIEGIGSKTKPYFWINAFIREFIGTLYSEKKKHITVFSLLALILMIMVVITFFANNL